MKKSIISNISGWEPPRRHPFEPPIPIPPEIPLPDDDDDPDEWEYLSFK